MWKGKSRRVLGKEEENYTGVQGEGNCKNDDSNECC